MITLFILFSLAGMLGWAVLSVVEDIGVQLHENEWRKDFGREPLPIRPLRQFHRN